MATAATPQIDHGSPEAFGERMKYRIRDMIANPYSFLPDYANYYNALLPYADSLTPHQAHAMSMLLGGDSARDFPEMPNTADLRFPEVDAFQPTCQVGWYYFAGRVTSVAGKDYSVLCMLYNNALLPQTYAQHFGIGDVQNEVVDAKSSFIRVAGERIELAVGTLWMDHQWGTGLTPNGKPRHETMRAAANLQPAAVPGWDFFVMNFEGNRSIDVERNSQRGQSAVCASNRPGPSRIDDRGGGWKVHGFVRRAV